MTGYNSTGHLKDGRNGVVDVSAEGHIGNCLVGSSDLIPNPQQFSEVVTNGFTWDRTQVGERLIMSLSTSRGCCGVEAFAENSPHVGRIVKMVDIWADVAGTRIAYSCGGVLHPLGIFALFCFMFAACGGSSIGRSVGWHLFAFVDDRPAHQGSE